MCHHDWNEWLVSHFLKPFPLSPFWVFGPSWIGSWGSLLDCKKEQFYFSSFIFSFYSCKGHSCKTCVLFVKLWNVVCFCHPFTTITLQLCHHHKHEHSKLKKNPFNSIQSKPNQSKPIPPNCSICFTEVRSHPKPKPKSELTKYTTFFHGEANPNLWTWTSLTQVPLYACIL